MSDPNTPEDTPEDRPPAYPPEPPTAPPTPPPGPAPGAWQSTGSWGPPPADQPAPQSAPPTVQGAVPPPAAPPPPTGQWGAPPPTQPPPGQWGAPPPPTQPPPGQWGSPPPSGPSGPPPVGADLPSTGPVPPAASRKKLIPVAIATVLVLAAGVFGFKLLSDSDGAAASPEEALEGFMSALADEDVIGMLASFTPNERDVLQNLAESTGGELERLGVVGDTFELEGVPGIDIELSDDVEYEVVEEVVADQLALVVPSAGEVTITFDPDTLEEGLVGDTLRDLLGDDPGLAEAIEEDEITLDFADLIEEAEGGAGSSFGFAAIDEGDGWVLSLGYTIAENVRQGELSRAEAFGDDPGPFADEPDIDDPAITAEGADSPEDAIIELINAAGSLDAERAIALLDPQEFGVLHVYAQYFIDDLRGAADGIDIPSGGFVEVTDLEADVTDAGNGGQRVTPTALSADIDFGESGGGSITLGDDCFAFEGEFDGASIDEEVCAGDDDILTGTIGGEDFADIEIPEQLVDAQEELAERFADVELGIVTVERDGEHFISPIRTVNDVLVGLSAIFESEDFEEGALIDDLVSGIGELADETGFDIDTGDDDIDDDIVIDIDDEIDDAEEALTISLLADDLMALDPSLTQSDAECVAEEGPIFELGLDRVIELSLDGFPGLDDPSSELGAAVVEGVEFCDLIDEPPPPPEVPVPDAPPLGPELARGQAGRAVVPAGGDVRVTIFGDGSPGVIIVRSVDGVVDPVVTLLDGAGNEIGRNDDGDIDPNLPTFDSELAITLPAGIPALAVITDFGGSDTGEVVIIYE